MEKTFNELRGIKLDDDNLNPLFYETLEQLRRFLGGDIWISSNGSDVTVCSVFRFIDRCMQDEKMIKFIPWSCVIGQKLAKKITDKLEFYKQEKIDEKNLQVGH